MLDSYDTALTPPISLGRAVRYIATYKSDLFLSAQHFALCSFAVVKMMRQADGLVRQALNERRHYTDR